MQKLMGYLSGVWDFCPGATEFERGFQAALILAALIFLLLIVLGLILKIVFRKPAVPGVTLEREDGDIFISRNAIYSAVRTLEDEFPALGILKVVMQRNRRRELELQINVEFEACGEAFDAVAGSFKQRVFAMLSKSFGIDSVKSVAINLAKIPAGRDADEDDSSKNVPPVPNTFTSGI